MVYVYVEVGKYLYIIKIGKYGVYFLRVDLKVVGNNFLN